MAVQPSEVEILVGELEARIDRLRALYEQYFLGFEKLEPLIPRKDVDRRLDVLRRMHFRNTAQRFKFNMLQQRYNTFQLYWLRICRQIEDGTYQRHTLKAKKRAEAEAKKNLETEAKKERDGWDIDVDVALDSPDDLFASFESAKTTPPSKPPMFTAMPPAASTDPSALLDADDPFASMSMAPAPLPSEAKKSLTRPTPGVAFKPSMLPPDRPGVEKKAILVRKAEPSAPRHPERGAAQSTVAPPNPPPSAPKAPPAPPKAPPSAPRAAGAPPKAPPSAPKGPPAPPNAPSSAARVAGAPPRPPPNAPKPAPGPTLARPAATADAKPAPARPPLPSSAGGAPKAAPAIRPKPIEGPRAAQKPDADPHVRALYTEYVNQKRARNEATEHLSYDAVAKSLKESGDKLAQKHQGKRVDFEVALKDGVTVLRPVIK